MEAQAFLNIDGTMFIAAFQKTADDPTRTWLVILRKTGETFQTTFRKEHLFSACKPLLGITDIAQEGLHEVSWEARYSGTGAAVRLLFIYLTNNGQCYEVSESRNHQAPAEPIAPRVAITPEPDSVTRPTIEKLAISRGFLQAPADPDDTRYAVGAWHSDNGTRRSGRITLKYYPGDPSNKSSETARLETNNVVWIAKFKGALYGYDREKDRHFVVYSPAWVYNWIDGLAWTGVLWFCDCRRSSLFCFEMIEGNDNEATLSYYDLYQGRRLPIISNLSTDHGILIINDHMKIDVAKLATTKDGVSVDGVSV
ncbi:MAG: hypothetical protein ACYDB1_00195 [Acidiferrobacteraceae bacterium]